MVAVDFTEAEGYCTEKKVSDFTVPSRDENGDRKVTHLFLQCGSHHLYRQIIDGSLLHWAVD
jgi:hypothetical protein